MWNILKKSRKKETKKQQIGRIGEDSACMFLMKQGFRILERNYWKKWGEIDIIGENKGVLHFIEVKTVSRENIRFVTRETLDEYRPEENVHPKKLERLHRTIETYLLEKKYEGEWQLDVVAVFLDSKNREAKCRIIENVV